MKQLLIAFSFLLSLTGYCQGDQTIIKVPISATATEQAIVHLPDDYATTTTKYPLLVFFHGDGEAVTPSAIYSSSTAGGPAYFIAQGKFPSSFINPADGKAYKFIVVSPQSPNPQTSTLTSQADFILSYMYKTYRVDTSRVTITGISAGGECALEYTTGLQGTGIAFLKTHKIAALIAMSAVMNGSQQPVMAATLLSNKIGIWGFGSPTDTHGANTLNLLWSVNNLKAGYGLSTSYAGGHCCWGQFYDPAFTQNGINIYQWALQYTSTGSTGVVVTTPPPVTIPACPVVDSAGIIKAYLAAHPCPAADSAGIIKAYVAGHPCPICPVCPKQRSMIGMHTDIVGGVCVESILYDDGSIQVISK